jgi:hypothetical protein
MKKVLLFAVLALSLSLNGTLAFGQHGDLNKIPHGMNPNAQSPIWPGFALTTGSTRKATAMSYGGGDLIGTPVIYIIWYGNWNQSNNGNKGDTPAGQAVIRQWASDIGGSPYYMLNTSLSVSGKPISGNVSFTANTNEATMTGPSTIGDADVQNIVMNAITSGALPYDVNGVYFVMTSSDVSESSGFCSNYCGWHTSSTMTGKGKLRYSFVGNASRCLSGCAAQSTSPSGYPGIDGAISVLSHELEEANTDPDPRSGWSDSRGSENADKCAWTFGHSQFSAPNGSWANMIINSHYYLIQRNILKTGSSFYCMVDQNTN